MSLYGLPKYGSSRIAISHWAMASSSLPRRLSDQPRKVWASVVGWIEIGLAVVLDGALILAVEVEEIAQLPCRPGPLLGGFGLLGGAEAARDQQQTAEKPVPASGSSRKPPKTHAAALLG
jgi:hypothetical protein